VNLIEPESPRPTFTSKTAPPGTDNPPKTVLHSYRAAVADVTAEISADKSGGLPSVAAVLGRRLAEPEIAGVLARTPAGAAAAVDALLVGLRRFRPNPRSSAADLGALVRVLLLSQIDAMWWGGAASLPTDDDLRSCADLVDLEDLRRDGRLRFDYRLQSDTLRSRAVSAAVRRLSPDRRPRTAGLRSARSRMETVMLLNQCAAEFAKNAPAGTPRLWVNSLARSLAHQTHMQSLGYAAVLPSAHCTGYAADVEMTWFRGSGAHVPLQQVLRGRMDDGDLNLIDEGQAWHVCVSPQAAPGLRHAFLDGADG
jgi:hypothetical protein